MPEDIFRDKKIILGITGSIAAYKAANLASMLIKKGAEVYPVMTQNATNFIGPVTLSSITGHKTIYRQFENQEKIYHISLPHSSDIMVIAPGSADTISKIANGICDDFLTTTAVSMKAPVLIAPAMNESMYLDPIFQESINRLKNSGKYFFIGPSIGRLACGEMGLGKMSPEEDIIEKIEGLLKYKDDLKDSTVIVTSGGTRESIDNVRYITNRSSGKMGNALAIEAYFRGAKKVYYITTVKEEIIPSGIIKIEVESADDMLREVLKKFGETDIVIMAAAVSDIKPSRKYDHKLRKKDQILSKLNFKLNVNILESLSKKKTSQLLVAFAAEDGIDAKKISDKFKDKKTDIIVANDISQKGIAFDSDFNEVFLIVENEIIKKIEKARKRIIARKLFDEIIKMSR